MTARVSMLLKSRASLTCFRACFLPGRAKDLSAPRYVNLYKYLEAQFEYMNLSEQKIFRTKFVGRGKTYFGLDMCAVHRSERF